MIYRGRGDEASAVLVLWEKGAEASPSRGVVLKPEGRRSCNADDCRPVAERRRTGIPDGHS
jgi:hypothetical protein